jgi:hypothetical protein
MISIRKIEQQNQFFFIYPLGKLYKLFFGSTVEITPITPMQTI